ncbi:M28 family peptidase [Parerythrobacter lacustris]|uniref:M28 family peptidase n=1 Tax=Parerythrobacter lacustris TaxID=2969984 RepID=A0ABT1XQU4_9SPHN|nr:M28 family peptidase [Parerythrobacter lacustris]MCR2833639.1 M28 family peptidase [Parerythrobacter lacustris]
MSGLRIGFALLLAAFLAACATMPSQRAAYQAERQALSDHIRVLSGPEYGGRMPGTEGGRMTQAYMVEKLTGYGFQPGAAGGSWHQPVTLQRFSPVSSRLTIRSGRQSLPLSGEGLLVRIRSESRTVKDAGIVFVADKQGLHAASLTGQVALVRADDMQAVATELLAAEPAAIVALFDDSAAFDRFARGFRNGRYGLITQPSDRTAFALLSPDLTRALYERLATDGEGLAARATEAGAPLPLDATADLAFETARETLETANVIGVLPGRVKGSGAVMLLAHWDHLGTCGGESDEDRLCNGAVDNASGVGVMLETARLIAAQGPLDRDLYIVGTTAEELGLLGAEAFAEDPPFPLPTIVAAFNMDTMAISPRGAPLTVIGDGRTPLDPGIRMVAESLGRKLDIREEHQAFVARQDGWALLSRDVPAVLVGSAMGDQSAFDAFMSTHYHAASDEWSPDMELGGATEDIFLHVELLRYFGNEVSYTPGKR